MRRNWCLCDGELKEGAQMAFFFFPGGRCVEGGRGVRSLCSRETSSTCRLISESSQRPPFIMAAGCCPATCQIGCPTPPNPPPPPPSIRHLSCTAVSCDPSASQCVFPSVCVRLRQDGEAVEDQREGQASGGLQPEG